jgi:hypothetical protein
MKEKTYAVVVAPRPACGRAACWLRSSLRLSPGVPGEHGAGSRRAGLTKSVTGGGRSSGRGQACEVRGAGATADRLRRPTENSDRGHPHLPAAQCPASRRGPHQEFPGAAVLAGEGLLAGQIRHRQAPWHTRNR